MSTPLPSAGSFVNLARDLLFVILYVQTIGANRSAAPWRKPLALSLLILLNVLMLLGDHYFYETLHDPNIAGGGHALIAVIRNIVYFISYFLYIHILKRVSLRIAIYDSLLISAICLACHNIFLTPITKPILDGTVVWADNPSLNRFLCVLVLNLFSILIYFLAYKFILLRSIKNVDDFRFILLLLLSLVSVYFNITIKLIEFIGDEHGRQLSGYVIILQLLLLICIGYFEHYQDAVQMQSRTALENQAVYSLLDSIKRQQKNDILLQHMRHDLRNHLISLRYLISGQKNEEAIEYIDSLSKEYVSFQSRIKTGNLIIDGILMQKMEVGQENDIAFSITVDFSHLASMDNADLCILFGNLLDNALEACLKVHDEPRFINIRGRQMGESVIYSIENSFNGDVEFVGGIPATTKAEKRLHGIGLDSVKRVADKYFGTVAFSSKGSRFSVVCTFPLPISSAPSHSAPSHSVSVFYSSALQRPPH